MSLIKTLLAVSVAACLLPGVASAAKILTYTDHEPLGGMRTQFIKDVFFPAIEKESHGRLKVEAHWNGELSTSYNALKTVAAGKNVDMAIVVPEYTPDVFPLQQIFKSFPVGPVGDKQIEFFRRVYADVPAFPEELQKANVVNLFFATGYPVAFFSTKPLKTLDDIKGTKWRTASFWHQDFLKNAGAIPVSMPWNDGIYKALEAGTLDGLMVNVDSGYQLKVHKTAPDILVSKDLWLGHVYLLVMNKQTWDGLAKEDREAISRAAEIAYQSLGAVMDKSMGSQIEELKKEGASVRVLKKDEVMKWQAATRYQEVQASWVKEQEAKGVKAAGATMDKVTHIMNDTMK
ncbi:TRAP transporter substrate-binding protein DctP [Enterobacteriaceae bacterium H20N1]|uniref:TRAP transporter substrate-binding protein DctP n=1 Tax=Dryocola boscaweniae TaxID=2925397 RepID=A0A9X3ACM9_9ENTR|nr:TRAP transporter substrate-binding protein DctP [Dryocola boscaweniae]MCT4703819.1 TRAP transporter substrate-binding protein DctP [Dryocola boscaweniae]MCT4716996.1 TRAP transporter substrate-binding protein DctP [Dryocola boscaweniae]MCT4720987.1 TRAP transporter substrate-binding protein DctP [Dryocola boscaweniae]